MSSFASGVVLGDLDDFIAPSQACIVPLVTQSNDRLDEMVINYLSVSLFFGGVYMCV